MSHHNENDPYARVDYLCRLNDEREIAYEFRLDPVSWVLQNESAEPPDWTKLDYYPCPGCPLSKKDGDHCPAAKNLSLITGDWREVRSYDPVEVEVTLEQRTIAATVSAQSAISTISGLLLGSSRCPTLSVFRPLARFHQPFAGPRESSYRVLMAYMTYQHLYQREEAFDPAAIVALYEKVETINQYLAKRIAHLPDDEAVAQAIVQLDCLSKHIIISLEETLELFRELFRDFDRAGMNGNSGGKAA